MILILKKDHLLNQKMIHIIIIKGHMNINQIQINHILQITNLSDKQE